MFWLDSAWDYCIILLCPIFHRSYVYVKKDEFIFKSHFESTLREKKKFKITVLLQQEVLDNTLKIDV